MFEEEKEKEEENGQLVKKAIREISAEAEMMYRRMIKLAIGEICDYEELSKIAGRDVCGNARGLLRTAVNKARRENRIVLETVRRVGVKRVDDCGIVDVAQTYRRRIKNASRTARQKLTCVENFAAMPLQKQREHNAAMVQLGIVELFASAKATDRIITETTKVPERLSLGNTMDLFRNEVK